MSILPAKGLIKQFAIQRKCCGEDMINLVPHATTFQLFQKVSAGQIDSN